MEAVEARDYEALAQLYAEREESLLLNAKRGMLQFLDCRGERVVWQVYMDVHAVEAELRKQRTRLQ
jgi:hypothetical protein